MSVKRMQELAGLASPKDYSNYTIADFKAMSDKEFEEFVKHEYAAYNKELKHQEDYIPYSEYFSELSAMMGRSSSSRRF